MYDAAHHDFGYLCKLLSQVYKVNQLGNSFQKFHGRYPDLIANYQRSVKDIVNDSFPF